MTITDTYCMMCTRQLSAGAQQCDHCGSRMIVVERERTRKQIEDVVEWDRPRRGRPPKSVQCQKGKQENV